MKKSVSALMLSMSALGVFSDAYAFDGTINFTGEIIDQGCEIGGGRSTINVDLGKVTVPSFSGTAGAVAGARSFDIALSNCPTEMSQVGVIFDGPLDSADTQLLALSGGAGAATGVGIALYEADAVTQIPLATPSKPNALDGATDVVLTYIAKYKSTAATVEAGKANATANFTLVYN